MYDVPDQSGRTILVTGANSGTGKEATKRLAAAGARVIMAVRSPERGEAARQDVLAAVPDADVTTRPLDLADLASVRALVAAVSDEEDHLDVLVNNAGVMIPPKRLSTTDGFELQLGTNFLGPFVLTLGLLPKLLDRAGARVATMSSTAANTGRIRFGDLQWRRGYVPWLAYSQSKLADLLMGVRLGAIAAERGWDLLSTNAHPGYTRTNLQSAGRSLGGRVGRERTTERTLLPSMGVEEGTEPLLHAIADPAATQGVYYGPSRAMVGPTHVASLPRSARGRDLPRSLWAVAEDLTGAALPG